MSDPIKDGPDVGPDDAASRGLARLPPWLWYTVLGGALLVIYFVSIRWCGPWDPWETHYGEVARNIVQRRDPLDLWWRPGYGPNGNSENTFWSKHAGPYWAMAASLWAFGIGANDALPGEMATHPWTEVALRLPSMVAGLTTIGFLAYVAHRLADWRAGVLVMVVLGTMPQFAIVTRQALTDMFFVGPVALAMGAWALAWMQDDRALRRVGRGRITVPVNDRAWIAFVILLAIAVILPLAVMHHHVNADYTIERVARFRKGKDIPNLQTLAIISRALIPYWIGVALVLVHSLTWTRRSQAWMGFVYVAGGLSLMGKGFIGPGIIGLLILCDMLVSGRLHLLPRCGLGMGTLLFLLACLPWHHAMWLYRGEGWFNELIVVNNLARFATGEQDQAVGSFTFYVKTLGIAGLPWSALAPIVLWDAFSRLRRPAPAARDNDAGISGDDDREGSRGWGDWLLRQLGHRGPLHRPARPTEVELHRFALLWFVISFGLITYSVTKYYHYLLPALPPLAVLTGLWLQGLLRKRRGGATRVTGAVGPALALAVLALAIAGLVLRQAVYEPAWIAHLTTYLYTGMWREGAPVPTRLVWMCAPLPIGVALWLGRRMPHAVAAWVLSGLLVTGYVIDDYLPAASESWSQRSAFRVYYAQRKPQDKVLSWWFYYRGETFFSKHRIWVLMRPDRQKLFDFIDEHRGKDVTFWMMTTVQHANRVHTQLPADVSKTAEVVYENHHYALVKAPIP